MARTDAGSRSGLDDYELHGHLSEKISRAIGNFFTNLSSSVGSISEEIYSRQAVYSSYTSKCCIFVIREFIRLWYIKLGAMYSRRLKRIHRDEGDTFYIDEVLAGVPDHSDQRQTTLLVAGC